MTGFGEQKLKCILWELATDDYEFRYEFLNKNYGELSTLKDKNAVLNHLIDQIVKYDGHIDQTSMKTKVYNNADNYCKKVFAESVFKLWKSKEYAEFIELIKINYIDQFFCNSTLLGSANEDLYKFYSHLYKQRNRYAHNLLSYQENLPTIKCISDNEYMKYENYFMWIFVLVLIDNLFCSLFAEYELCKNNNY